MKRHLTEHAVYRYRSRIDKNATVEEIQAALDTGPVHYSAPWGVADRPPAGTAGFVIAAEAVFPLVVEGSEYLAVTTLRRRRKRIPKADRRMAREIARDEAWAA